MLIQQCFSPPSGLVTLCLIVGCGGGVSKAPEEKLVQASGVVQVDGKPAVGVRIRLTPMISDGAKTVGGAWAITGNDGSFKFIHWTNKDGVVPGDYLATFSRMVKPDGSPLGEKESPIMVNAKETIAPKWSSLEVDRQTVEARRLVVPAAGKTDIQFSIKSAPTA